MAPFDEISTFFYHSIGSTLNVVGNVIPTVFYGVFAENADSDFALREAEIQ